MRKIGKVLQNGVNERSTSSAPSRSCRSFPFTVHPCPCRDLHLVITFAVASLHGQLENLPAIGELPMVSDFGPSIFYVDYHTFGRVSCRRDRKTLKTGNVGAPPVDSNRLHVGLLLCQHTLKTLLSCWFLNCWT